MALVRIDPVKFETALITAFATHKSAPSLTTDQLKLLVTDTLKKTAAAPPSFVWTAVKMITGTAFAAATLVALDALYYNCHGLGRASQFLQASYDTCWIEGRPLAKEAETQVLTAWKHAKGFVNSLRG